MTIIVHNRKVELPNKTEVELPNSDGLKNQKRTDFSSLMRDSFGFSKPIFCLDRTVIDDISLLDLEQIRKIEKSVNDIIDNKFPFLFSKRQEFFIKSYVYAARSHFFYQPILQQWVKYLFNKALVLDSDIIFLARDGLAAYSLAQQLLNKERYRHLRKRIKVHAAWFSRKLIGSIDHTSIDLFNRYLSQMQLKEKRNYIVADIGFSGSMIERLIKFLPNNRLHFEYIISRTPKAEGFLVGPEKPPLSALTYAGGNPAVHFLEDSHSGILKTATRLVEVGGVIYPDSLVPQNYAFIDNPEEFIIREITFNSVTTLTKKNKLDRLNKTALFILFNAFLMTIKDKQRPLFIEHIPTAKELGVQLMFEIYRKRVTLD